MRNRITPKTIGQTRQVKVHQTAYYRTVKETTCPTVARSIGSAVPAIRISGKWLERAGFSINTPVKIRVMEDCLVLTVERDAPD